jgi:hypothetical protein
MRLRLPILTGVGTFAAGLVILAALAQIGLPEGPVEPYRIAHNVYDGNAVPSPADPNRLLEQSILALESRPSIEATIRYKADLFGHKPIGLGVYQELRAGSAPDRELLYRYELRTQVDDQPSSLVQVCDGRYLWTYRDLGGGRSLSRIDVVRAREILENTSDIDGSGRLRDLYELRGLPKLLRGLHAAFEFSLVGQTRLAGQLAVWKLRGQWRKEKLAQALPQEQSAIEAGEPPDLTKLPGHLPDHVLLFLGKADGFPYRIQYQRRESERQPAQDLASDRSILTMEFFGVNLNASIDPARFVYHPPGDLECPDETAEYLRSLGADR